jgi:SAM-dependent methyltransferase
MNMVLLENQRALSAFKFHFNGVCDISEISLTSKYYRITFTTKKTLHYLLNLVNLFASFIVMTNESEYLHIDEETVEKYFQSLQGVDAPYFIRYSFKTDLLRGPKLFDKYKPLLETSSRYPIQMVFGDTIRMRYDWVASHISTEHNIVDVGCGSGKYVFNLAPKLNKGCQYIAIDTDPDIRDSLNRKVSIKELSNVVVLDNLDAIPIFSNTEPIDFLLTEVLEHMPLSKATNTLQKCLNHPRFNAAYITTPNKDFNPFYFDSETQFRHSEHIFEFTENEFIGWLKSFDMPLCVIYCPVGDIVDGKPTTLGAIVTRKEVQNVL